MRKPATVIRDYVLGAIEREPIHTRIELLRALAAVTATGPESRSLCEMADALAAVQSRHEQLVLDFKRRARG